MEYETSSSCEVDPLDLPEMSGVHAIISFIEDQSVIRDILNHLGLWLTRARPPPKLTAPWGYDAAAVEGVPRNGAAGDLQLQTH